MISTILVATDGSEAAANAERFGVTLASRMKARLACISVVEDRFTRGFTEDGLGVSPPSPEPVAQYLRQRAEAACSRVQKAASARTSSARPSR
jgi:nucleotide-binding universal stress UspA family protein